MKLFALLFTSQSNFTRIANLVFTNADVTGNSFCFFFFFNLFLSQFSAKEGQAEFVWGIYGRY